jgi:hypothetical protein
MAIASSDQVDPLERRTRFHKADAVGGKAEKLLPLLGVYLLDSSLSLLMVSVAISGLSVLVLEHSGDPGEPDRQSVAFGRSQSV